MKARTTQRLTPQNSDLITRVLQLMGVTGAPSLEEFTQACRVIREVAGELRREFDVKPKRRVH